MREYLEASAYFRQIGAQTPSAKYGGSRSMIYYQMLGQATTIRELRDARITYNALHKDDASNHDEYGGVLRILGYRMRKVPLVGPWLEGRVRQDDELMAHAAFDYPPSYERYSAPLEELPTADTAPDVPMGEHSL